MTRRFRVLLALLAVPLTSACLLKTTTHRLYLSPDGALAWTVLEQDVRSTESTPSARAAEEQAYLDRVRSQTHPPLEAFAPLLPDRMTVGVLRAERPYAVLTEARFERVDAVVERLLGELHVPGSATLQRAGNETTLVVALDLSAAGDQEIETPVTALIEELDAYRVVLTEGRFVAAAGFEIVEDGSAAVLKSQQVPIDRAAELRLTWK